MMWVCSGNPLSLPFKVSIFSFLFILLGRQGHEVFSQSYRRSNEWRGSLKTVGYQRGQGSQRGLE